MSVKPKQKAPVEVVKDPKSGVEVTVFYDREKREFFGDVPQVGASRGKDLQAVLREVQENLARARSFEWRAVITIEHAGGDHAGERSHGRRARYRSEGASLSFSFWRSEIAPKPGAKGHDARFIERPHVLDVEKADAPSWMGPAREKGEDVHDHYGARDGHEVIPYSEEAWAALWRLKAATERAHAQLVGLFKEPDRLLSASTTLMLPSDVGASREQGEG